MAVKLNLFTIVAVILHLSNIDFLLLVRMMQSGKSRQSLDIVARLLFVKSEDYGYTIINKRFLLRRKLRIWLRMVLNDGKKMFKRPGRLLHKLT